MVDSKYLDAIESAGLKVAATFDDNKTPCLFELENHPFFVGALFQPQIVSTQKSPHPLIKRFLKIANSQLVSTNEKAPPNWCVGAFHNGAFKISPIHSVH